MSDEEAARLLRNFIRQVKRLHKKMGLPPLKYIAVTERGKRGGRYHHHVTLSGDVLEGLWKHGYVNSRYLQFTEDGLAGLGNYIMKSPVGKKAWSASKKLVDPEPKTRDGHISAKKPGSWPRISKTTRNLKSFIRAILCLLRKYFTMM